MSATQHRINTGVRPLPPYGKQLVERIRRGEIPNTFIMAGADAWDRQRIRVDRVVLPPDLSPDEYDWSIFCGLEPTVIGDQNDKRLRYLVWLLLNAGAKLIAVIYWEDGVIRCDHVRIE